MFEKQNFVAERNWERIKQKTESVRNRNLTTMETRNLLIRTIGKMDRLGMESLHYAIMEELA